MERLVVAMMLVGCGSMASEPPPPPGPRDLAGLASPSWLEVSKARLALLVDRAAVLAPLVALVDRDDRIPLTETADLIYPGAKQFYGHGYVVPYDLDHLGDRAGWVLEELTFQDFGFSDGVPMMGPEDLAHAATRRAHARAAVHAWWATAGAGWSCYAALGEALRGLHPGPAYAWLRAWDAAPCDGFTAEKFRADLLPVVQRHAGDPAHPLHEQAALLLGDLETQLPRLTMLPNATVLARLGAITPQTTVADLETFLGKPTEDIGSGIHIFVYPLRDGLLRVGSADARQIMYVRIVAHGSERVLYQRS